jgi:hypothetical protein
LISGGDALVEVAIPGGGSSSGMVMNLNGQDVTDQFAIRQNGRYMGVLSTLGLGSNVLTARLDNQSVAITIINHPIGGPLFSGPQLQPWACQTGAGDAQCNQPIEYTYLYKSSDPTKNGLQAYDPTKPATDVASTTTDQGITVPFIVRQELGYEDRNQYLILTLFQPGMAWTPWNASASVESQASHHPRRRGRRHVWRISCPTRRLLRNHSGDPSARRKLCHGARPGICRDVHGARKQWR